MFSLPTVAAYLYEQTKAIFISYEALFEELNCYRRGIQGGKSWFFS